jgi:hypothetical protein
VHDNCAETADWGLKADSPMCVDPMYVLVYDTQAALPGKKNGDYKHKDGYAKTMRFVRFDDFANWCACAFP